MQIEIGGVLPAGIADYERETGANRLLPHDRLVSRKDRDIGDVHVPVNTFRSLPSHEMNSTARLVGGGPKERGIFGLAVRHASGDEDVRAVKLGRIDCRDNVLGALAPIGRASCRERVCTYV